MSALSNVRYAVPRFAQCFMRSTVNTVPIIPRGIARFPPKRSITISAPKSKKETVSITYELADGTKLTAPAAVGDNLLDVIVDNDLDMDGFGACEGTLACSTCHLIFKQEDYDKLPEEPSDEELDMLDLAYGLTDRSRLGCQIIVTKDMDGLVVQVPAGVADAREPS